MRWGSEVEDRKKGEYRSSKRSKTLIKKALLKLMHEKKFEEISVTDIVREADINRGTFYAHYSNVQDVIRKMEEEMLVGFVSSLEVFSSDELLDDPRPIFVTISSFLLKDPGYYKMLFSLPGVHDHILGHKDFLFTYFLSSRKARKMVEAGKRDEFIAIVDFWISGILNLYIDIELGRVLLRLDEAPDFLMRMINLTSEKWLGGFASDAEAAEAEQKER